MDKPKRRTGQKYWTDKKVAHAAKQNAMGIPIAAIAAKHGVTSDSLYIQLRRRGIPIVPPSLWTMARAQQAYETYKQTRNLKFTASRYGIKSNRLSSIFKQHGFIVQRTEYVGGPFGVVHDCVYHDGICILCDKAREAVSA